MTPSTVADLVRSAATDRPLVTDGRQGMTGRQLLRAVSDLADTIAATGSRRVALLADNGVAWILADLACQLAAVTLLPVPTFFSAGQRRFALADAGIDLLLTDRPVDSHIAFLPEPEATRAGLAVHRQTVPPLEPVASLPEGTGKITYTSGSTGTPKGVCLGNQQLVLQARALAEAVAIPGNRHLCLLPLSVLLENVAGVYTTLISDGTVIAPPLAELGYSGSSTLDIEKLLAALARHRPNTLILTPQLLTALILACDSGWHPPNSLRFVAVGGGKVAPGLVMNARRRGLPVYEGYGLSECASVVSLNTRQRDRPGSVGKPLSHLRVACDDGEVKIAGNPFLGYVNDPASWYREEIASGDLGRLDGDGYLHLSGRRDNLIISSFGRNISPEWVESELLSLPLIQEAVVFGEGRPWLSALIYPHQMCTGKAEVEQRIRQVNDALPDYARVRRWLALDTPLAAIPGLTTATGKPRRAAILAHFRPAIEQLYEDSPMEVASCE